MPTVRTDNGTKYKQAVVEATPAYAASGVRMEDAHATRRLRSGVVHLCVADGHGSIKQAHGVHVGAREMADAACATAMAQLEAGKSAPEAMHAVFRSCQAAARGVLEAYEHVWEDGVLRIATSERMNTLVPVCGTTLSVAVLRPGRRSTFAWVGDSLGVLVRGTGEIVPLGVPHSVHHKAERERMRQGGVNVEKDRYFEYRVQGGSKIRIAISRTLGHFGHTPLLHEPETFTFTPFPGDRVLVATDGLWDACTQTRAGKVLSVAQSEADACEALLTIAKTAPVPRDNVTIACAFLEREEPGVCCVLS